MVLWVLCSVKGSSRSSCEMKVTMQSRKLEWKMQYKVGFSRLGSEGWMCIVIINSFIVLWCLDLRSFAFSLCCTCGFAYSTIDSDGENGYESLLMAEFFDSVACEAFVLEWVCVLSTKEETKDRTLAPCFERYSSSFILALLTQTKGAWAFYLGHAIEFLMNQSQHRKKARKRILPGKLGSGIGEDASSWDRGRLPQPAQGCIAAIVVAIRDYQTLLDQFFTSRLGYPMTKNAPAISYRAKR